MPTREQLHLNWEMEMEFPELRRVDPFSRKDDFTNNKKANLMNWNFFKHREKKHIIDQAGFDKLPPDHKRDYDRTDEDPTHQVDDDSVSILPLLAAGEESGPSFVDEAADVPDEAFGGGSGGGGGAEGDFGTENNNNDNGTEISDQGDNSDSATEESSDTSAGESDSGSSDSSD